MAQAMVIKQILILSMFTSSMVSPEIARTCATANWNSNVQTGESEFTNGMRYVIHTTTTPLVQQFFHEPNNSSTSPKTLPNVSRPQKFFHAYFLSYVETIVLLMQKINEMVHIFPHMQMCQEWENVFWNAKNICLVYIDPFNQVSKLCWNRFMS